MSSNINNDYVSHEGQLYLYWRGNFYKKGIGGQLDNVFNQGLHLELLALWTKQQPTNGKHEAA